MSAAIFSKWGRIERGLPVTVSPDDLQLVRLADFRQVARDTGLRVRVERLRAGWYRVTAA